MIALQGIIKSLILISIFYVFSISLTFYNSNVISMYQFPLFITFTHLMAKFIFASFFRGFYQVIYKKSRIVLGWNQYIKCFAIAGIASALDIGLSNWSFEYITISLYTMTKSTSIIFIAVFGILMKVEEKRISLLFVSIFISAGLFMFSYESSQFNINGFLLVLTASFLSGVRWILAQFIVQHASMGLSNPLDMMYHIQPWMAITLLPLAMSLESSQLLTSRALFRPLSFSGWALSVSYIFGGVILAFGLELAEFLVICNDSSLTLSVASIFKEICTILLASLIKHDKMSPVNVVGFLFCISGIALHVWDRYTKAKAKEHEVKSNIPYERIQNTSSPIDEM